MSIITNTETNQQPSGPCECGAGIRRTAQGIEIRPHDLGCPTLAKIVERGKTHCTGCNAVLVTERNGQIVYCPNGHTRELSGEAALEFFDATGSGWVREELERNYSPDIGDC